MTFPFRLVSADSHVAEPPDLWTTRVDRDWRDRVPRLVSTDTGDAWMINGRVRGPIGLYATRRKYEDSDAQFGHAGWWADVPAGAYDPAARVTEMDREGMEAEVLYTSAALGLFRLRDRDMRRVCLRAYNDWLAEHCSGAPKRLFGVAMIATDDVDLAVAELERCVGMGLRGVMVSIGQASGESYDEPRFERFWSATAARGVAVSLHVAASETAWQDTGSQWVNFACGFTPTMYAITSMIFSGLFDRHPGLKVLSVENDASWALAVLERMDDRWVHDKGWAQATGKGSAITSDRTPSQIFRDHVGCTFMRDRTAIRNRDIIGRQNLMWGSDYPHFDGAWPDCAARLEAQFEGVSMEDQMAIGRNNAIQFYGLPLEIATPEAATAGAPA